MKRLLLLSVMFYIGLLKGLAQGNNFTYTDENGVNWECSLSFNMIPMPDGNYKDTTYVYINSASNYGEEVVVPRVVKYEGKDYTITQLGSIFCNNQTLKKVTLPESVTSLSSTFDGCTLLSEVVNTDQILSCNYAFNNCKSLKSIDLSNCKTIGGRAFGGCQNLQSVNLKKCKTIEWDAFSGCSNLQSVGDLSSCTTIGRSAFQSCSSLKSIDISSCTSLDDDVFQGCSKLEDVKLSKQLNQISQQTFGGCKNLKSIDLSYCRSIGGSAFSGCQSLTSVGNTALLNTIQGSAFWGCSNLTTIDLSNCTFIGEWAFSSCAKLSNINLSKCKLLGNGAFNQCTELTEVDLSSCSSLAESVFSGCSNLKTIKGIENFTTIPANAFTEIGIETLSLPLCTTIQEGAFRRCSQLKSVNLPKCETIEGYKPEYSEANGAFTSCNNLREVELPSCINIGEYTFASCGNLNAVSLPNTIQKLGYKCFDGNTSLTLYAKNVPTLDRYPGTMSESDTLALGKNVLIIVPEESLAAYQTADVWKTMSERIFPLGTQFEYDVEATAQANTSGLQKAIGEKNLRSVVTLKVKGSINSYDIMVMRNKMDNLHYLDLADADVKSNTYDYYTGYSTQDDILGPHSFADLDKLLTVKLPKSVKYIDQAFNNCSQLRSVEMPENLIRIGSYHDYEWGMMDNGAFVDCTNLEEIIFHNCERIGGDAFNRCNSLKEITLPKNLKHVGRSAFGGCI